eukprot:TRINITY_DN12969_c0_g1_i1.p1 TRINITY_DN12969_c0_g1~~TRINITY_DN12969_c0_g1_i1.p1  ORF type:complete len:297 (-),score=108.49 TRINITY_DN12969_c0_g1_i1:139-1029(-)
MTFFTDTTVDALNTGKAVVEVDSEASVAVALSQLKTANVYSAPVWNAAENKYEGLVDLADVVAIIASLVSENPTESAYDLKGDLQKTPVKDIVNKSKFNHYVTLPMGTPLQDVVNIFAKGDAKRISILNKEGRTAQVVSPSSIVRFLHKNVDKLGDISAKPISELEIATREIEKINGHVRAIDAYAKMLEMGISAMGIEANGEIIGLVSVKDIKYIVEDVHQLFRSVDDYVKFVRQHNLKTVHPTIHSSLDDSLAAVIGKLTVVNIHRVFLKEKNVEKTVGILSVRDILKTFQTNK